jgi:hypothetical protein
LDVFSEYWFKLVNTKYEKRRVEQDTCRVLIGNGSSEKCKSVSDVLLNVVVTYTIAATSDSIFSRSISIIPFIYSVHRLH